MLGDSPEITNKPSKDIIKSLQGIKEEEHDAELKEKIQKTCRS